MDIDIKLKDSQSKAPIDSVGINVNGRVSGTLSIFGVLGHRLKARDLS